jgi:uncharacterized membrane protein YccF (DUF307 family)
METLGNIIWVIFEISFDKQHFKPAHLALMPFGKK